MKGRRGCPAGVGEQGRTPSPAGMPAWAAGAGGTCRCEAAAPVVPPVPKPLASRSLTCLEVEGDAGLGEVGGVALGADAADGSAVDVLLGRCRH